jgi:hypothetical protein
MVFLKREAFMGEGESRPGRLPSFKIDIGICQSLIASYKSTYLEQI